MTSLTRDLWGREFDLDVRFEDLDDEGIDDAQWDAYASILLAWSALENCLPKLKRYCLDENPAEIGSDSIENIFRFVIPKYLFIAKDTEKRTVALMCDYRFDPEHGIAIVFENEGLAEIGPQDIVL